MTQLLQNAAYGTALILALAALRRVLKDRLLPEARLALWAVCLFRLLTPAAPESVLSLWGLFSKHAPAPVRTPQPYLPAPLPSAPAPQPSGPAFSWGTALALVWLAVGAALAFRYVLSWRRTRRAVAGAIPLGRDDPRYAPLPKCARLREGVMEGAPLTFGAVRPTVVLSPGLEGEELICVLAHEGVHAARRDNLWHYAMALALAVHWWNPAVWLMSRLLRRDIELACDRAAVKKLGPDKRAQYAQALVTLATQGADPAFCQTFGRKAAEERILSIMKFKKTSIIGVIFSLTLVLAVTAAFASEPKEPDTTVQFHGQTFSRSELSQGTLDWLDWYLALTEEEQLAISYVPAELYKDRDTSTQDAYSSEKTASEQTVFVPDLEATKEIQSGFPEIDPDDVDLSEMKKMLDKKVADGQLTREAAGQRLTGTEQMLDQARRGELKLFWYDNGGGESWVYGVGIFLVNGETRSQFVDPGQVLQPLYHKDDTGKLLPVDPSTVTNGYGLFSAPDQPTYVEEGESIAEGDAALMGEGDIIYDKGKTPSDYDVKLPTFDEDGNPVINGIIGTRFSEYREEDAPSAAGKIGSQFYSYKVEQSDSVSGGYVLDSRDASNSPVRTSSGLYDLCKEETCKVSYDHCHIDGKVVRAYYQNPGLLCAHDGCDNDKPHEHDGVKYAGKAGSFVVLPRNPGVLSTAGSVSIENVNDDGSPIVTVQGGGPAENPVPMTLEQYEALLDSLVSKGQLSREDARDMLSLAQEHMKGQEFPYLWTTEGGSYAVTGRPKLCTQAGCHDSGVHAHDGVYYTGCAEQNSAPSPAPSAVPVSSGCRQNHHGNCHH